ncbi:MmcQ/YjbR family DNA-binding protein [Sphingobacterium bovistauri]|nr:MmcQ/YjbR family DNA-binding protein [Sphingobacterium bovistauri]
MVSEELPFGPDTLVFKIAGKVFLLIGLDQVENMSFNVKCDPEYAIELREKYQHTVLPGYHMNKKHWNTVFLGRELNTTQLKELIDHSFDLVKLSLPKNIRDTI